MSEKNHIDELFKSKLQGKEVAYSESAWKGAEQLLHHHYRWVFLKKALMVLIPVVVISGLGVGYLLQSTDTTPIDETTMPSSGFVVEQDVALPSTPSTGGSESPEYDNTVAKGSMVSSPDASAGANHSNAAASYGDASATPSVNKREVANSSKNLSSTADAKKVKSNHDVLLPPGFDTLLDDLASDDGESKTSAAPSQHPMTSTEVAAIKLKSSLDLMALAELKRNSYSTPKIQDTQESPAMKALRNIQLFADLGGVVGLGYHDLSGERMHPGFGIQTQLLAKYHFQQALSFDMGLGIYNRSSLTANIPFAGNEPSTTVQITPLSSQYASIYAGMGYRIGARHTIEMGMQINPLLTVVARKEKFVDNELASEELITDANGFNQLDVSFNLNYRVSIHERVDAYTGFQFGLFDATDNGVFKSGDINDYNRLIKLGLSYRVTQR